jgi:hypothetical protein
LTAWSKRPHNTEPATPVWLFPVNLVMVQRETVISPITDAFLLEKSQPPVLSIDPGRTSPPQSRFRRTRCPVTGDIAGEPVMIGEPLPSTLVESDSGSWLAPRHLCACSLSGLLPRKTESFRLRDSHSLRWALPKPFNYDPVFSLPERLTGLSRSILQLRHHNGRNLT